MGKGGLVNKAIMFYNVHGRQRWIEQNSEEIMGQVLKPSISFFNETWLTEDKYTEFCPIVKDHHHEYAKKTGGRPSGGIEAVFSKGINGRIITSSQNHIGVAFANIFAINVYYKPELEFDDKVADLITALEKRPPGTAAIIGGDFNIKPEEDEFEELQLLLADMYRITLVSDPNAPTYSYTKQLKNKMGKVIKELPANSTLDHIFAHEALNIVKTSVGAFKGSDHEPIIVIVKVKRNLLKKRKLGLAGVPKGFVKTEDLQEALKSKKNLFALASPDEQISMLNKVVLSLNKKKKIKQTFSLKKHFHKPWFNEYLNNLRGIMLDLLSKSKEKPQDTILHMRYLIARRAFHASCKSHKEEYEKNKIQNMIDLANNEGIRSVYNMMKSTKTNPYIDTAVFIKHLHDLYNPKDTVKPQEVESCERDSSILNSPITIEEVETALKALKSSAIANMGISPKTLKESAEEIKIILSSIYNQILSTGKFPELWMKIACIFLHKKGDRKDPNNFRTICIQNAFMKVFGKIVSSRISKFQEFYGIVPDCQFGFRPEHSTAAAVTILHELVIENLQKTQKVYAAFIDLKKAFDTISRQILFHKMLDAGYPRNFVNLVTTEYGSFSMSVRSEGNNYGDIGTTIGCLQGHCNSPLLFNLFTADLPSIFDGQGATLAGKKIPLILYADDMVILSNSPTELQDMLNKLGTYLNKNKLKMNTDKTKIMIFHKGRLPDTAKRDFYADNVIFEKVKEFVYLGLTLTPQLAYSKHLEKINAKARARMGQIFSKTPVLNTDFKMAQDLFNVYIKALYDYCSAIWTTNINKSANDNMKRVYLKYLKRYLGVPKSSSTDISYLACGVKPLSQKMFEDPTKPLRSLNLSIPLPGHQLNLVKNQPEKEEDYKFEKEVPPKFWEIFNSQYRLPANFYHRRKFSRKLFDTDHKKLCNRSKVDFHNYADPLKCVCKDCNNPMDWYHECQFILTNEVAS